MLVSLATKVEGVLAKVKGVEEGAHEITPSGPELTVRVDPTKAGLLGLSPRDVADLLELSMFGRVETYAPRGDRLIALRAVYPKEARRTEAQIRRLPVYAKDGRTLGVGSGQTNRKDSARIAALRARDFGLELNGCACASEAFFPFADGLIEAVEAGAVEDGSAAGAPGGHGEPLPQDSPQP